jgi:HSP20 family protein
MQPGWLPEPFGDVFMDRMYPMPVGPTGFEEEGFRPSIDLRRSDGGYELTAELPGVDKQDINIEVDNNTVTISGEKSAQREDREEGQYYVQESSYGYFSRTIQLPADVDESKTEANYNDGVLTVSLPTREKSRQSRIEVK